LKSDNSIFTILENFLFTNHGPQWRIQSGAHPAPPPLLQSQSVYSSKVRNYITVLDEMWQKSFVPDNTIKSMLKWH